AEAPTPLVVTSLVTAPIRKLVWLNRLVASKRISTLIRSVILVFLMTDPSTSQKLGPRRWTNWPNWPARVVRPMKGAPGLNDLPDGHCPNAQAEFCARFGGRK